MALQRLQPKIKKIQELHKNDKQKQTEAIMALYKEHGVNPFLSIILLVVQLPILISLYQNHSLRSSAREVLGRASTPLSPHRKRSTPYSLASSI